MVGKSFPRLWEHAVDMQRPMWIYIGVYGCIWICIGLYCCITICIGLSGKGLAQTANASVQIANGSVQIANGFERSLCLHSVRCHGK
jgi:hypothetical protein